MNGNPQLDRNMNMKYIIAVDLGGTITKVGLLRNGELVDYVKIAFSSRFGYDSKFAGD